MGRQENTKELFIFEALKLFGERGFDSVRISDIAKEVGCTAPALYKHYENKQQLYDAILEESRKGFDASISKNTLDFDAQPELKEKFLSLSEDEQIENVKQIFLHTLHDPWISAFRKLMTIEQFHKPELARMYNERYVYMQNNRHSVWFKALMDSGKMKKGDENTLAFMYTAPISVLIGLCDREPEKEAWALEAIEKHVREFNKTYRIQN